MPEGVERRRERWERAALGWWEVKRLWRRELGKRGSGLDGEEDIVVVVCGACCGYTGGCADLRIGWDSYRQQESEL